MDVHEIDVHDDDLFHSFYATLRDAEMFERPHANFWSEREAAAMFRIPELTESWNAFAAFDGDVLVGGGFTVVPVADNLDKAYAGVHVAPPQRGRGAGSALVDFVVGQSRQAGRDTVLVESNYPFERRSDHPYRRFAERHGFTLANFEVERTLELPVPIAQLDEWEAEAAPHHRDYQIKTFHDSIPDELLESYCYLHNQLVVDAPTGEVEYEAEALTPEAFRVREAKIRAQGRTVYSTAALNAQGDAVAHTELVVSAERDVVGQSATLVRRDDRGHRLGLAVKARNLRVMQANHPDKTRINTCNSEDNDAMVLINEKMGFTPVELLAEFQRKLS